MTRPGAPSPEDARPGRVPLGEASSEPLETSIEPVAGGRSVLFVAQAAGERVAWARRWGGAAKSMGPLLRFQDEHVLSAFEGDGGEPLTVVTADGERVCLSTFQEKSSAPVERGCVEAAPFGVVAVGERFAMIEVEVERKPEPPGAAKAAARKGERPSAPAAKKTTKSAKKAGAGAAKKPKPVKRPSGAAKTTSTTKGGAKTGTASSKGATKDASATKGTTKNPKAQSAQKKPAKRAEATTRRPPRTDKVNVKLRWLTRAGAFDGEAVATGLSFERPLEGLALIDARGRPGAIDLAWYETSPKRLTTAPMGSARIAAGSIREGGAFDPASRVPVLEGDLDYGGIAGHHAGRLVGTSHGTLFVGLTGRPGGCEAVRVAPSLSLLKPAPALCAIAPHRLLDAGGAGGGGSAEELAVMERILASDPRRTFGQPRHEPGLAAWAGDRAFFAFAIARDEKVAWATATDGEAREAEAPFAARRSRIAWGALHPDGDGIAYAEGIWRLDAQGNAARAAAPDTKASAAPGAPAPPLSAPERSGIERRRAARIGSTWWLARGDVVRVHPAPGEAASLRGRAHPETSILVGGPARGIFVEVSGERLTRLAIDADGNVSDLAAGAPASQAASPVRAGLDAAPRAGGGAIVAGVSASNAGKVVAFTLADDGKVSAAAETSLRVAEGELAVRLIALPSGGALLSDTARRQVVWLDNDAREVAAAQWPTDHNETVCLDGLPGRLVIPSPVPGVMARVPELAAPGTCVIGDFAWAKDGSLRWFGSYVRGLDSIAEAAIINTKIAHAASPAAPSTNSPPSSAVPPQTPALPSEPPCPSDMVSIAGQFCIDRFESMIIDASTGEALSPDFPTTPNLLEHVLAEWSTGRSRMGDVHGKAMPLPWLPRWQRGKKISPAAVSRMGARPSGYLTGLVAESACAAAGKRLCALDELTTACRGEDDTPFPYGDTYEEGACNVFREDHPAAILHGNASVGHLDPRLNRVRAEGGPLLRLTGATPRCRSRWGSDAVYDLVGNLDEWVDDEDGAFAGGFYSRSTRAGCDAVITSHPKNYLDYSTGVRCCRDAAGATTDAAHE